MFNFTIYGIVYHWFNVMLSDDGETSMYLSTCLTLSLYDLCRSFRVLLINLICPVHTGLFHLI